MKIFTKQQIKAVSGYIMYLLEQLDMRQWNIQLIHEPANIGSSNAAAAIKTTYGRNRASLFLSYDFFTYPIEEIEHYLIHEVCHLLSAHVDDVINNGPETLMGKPAFTMFHESYNAASERMTDHLAEIFRKSFEDGPRRKKLIAALNNVRVE